MSLLYTIKVTFKGLGKSVSVSHQEHMLTRIYRLSTQDRTKMQQHKVSLYRLISKWAVFKLDESYIIPETALPIIEDGFTEIYAKFNTLRESVYNDITANWQKIEQDMQDYLAKMGIDEDLDSLEPPDSAEELLDLGYTLTPLADSLQQLMGTSKNLQGVDARVAQRLKTEYEKKVEQLDKQYEKKIKELQETADKLKEKDKLKAGEMRTLQIQLSALKDQTESIAPLLGEQKEEDLKSRLEAMKEYFTDMLPSATETRERVPEDHRDHDSKLADTINQVEQDKRLRERVKGRK